MTHTTDQDRAEFEAWADNEFYDGIASVGDTWSDARNMYTDAAHHMAFYAWQAARRAQVVPNVVQMQDAEKKIAELLALARIMVRAALDADNKTEMPEIKAAIESEVEFERTLRNTIAAAPQPPEAAQLDDIDVADMAQAVDSTEAAPVQMPEPISKMLEDYRSRAIDYATCPSPSNNTRMETAFQSLEHQVRQLLAAHNIKPKPYPHHHTRSHPRSPESSVHYADTGCRARSMATVRAVRI